MPENMFRLNFYDPIGAVAVTNSHAPRLDTLMGKKIGFISTDEWQTHRTFALLESLLKKDFENIDLLSMDTFPRGIGPISTEEASSLVAQSGVDAIIIGNAA